MVLDFFFIVIFNKANMAGNMPGCIYPAENQNEKMCAATGPVI